MLFTGITWPSRLGHKYLIFYLVGVDAFSHGPGRHHVVHHPLGQGFGYLVQLHELPHVVEHLVVLGGGRGHLLDDGGDVAEDGGVEQRCGDKEAVVMWILW